MRQTLRFAGTMLFVSILTNGWADDTPPSPAEEPPAAEVEPDPEFAPTPGERRLLGLLDRDSDGVLSRSDVERLPGPMRKWLQANTMEPKDDIPTEAFGPTLRAMLADLRDGRFSTRTSRRRPTPSAVAVASRDTPSDSGPDQGRDDDRGRDDRRSSGGSEKAAPVTFLRVDTKGYDGIVAERAFMKLDKNEDGKLAKEEFDLATRTMFTGGGVTAFDEMDLDTFKQHHVRISRGQ